MWLYYHIYSQFGNQIIIKLSKEILFVENKIHALSFYSVQKSPSQILNNWNDIKKRNNPIKYQLDITNQKPKEIDAVEKIRERLGAISFNK